MQTSFRVWFVAMLILSLSVLVGASFAMPQAPASAEIADTKAGAGPCSADFVVKDSSGKGIFGATIDIQVKYGFMGLHKVGATVGTNVNGKARIEGLPEQIKKTAEFKVSSGSESKYLPYDPDTDCHAQHEVVLGTK